MFTTYVLQSRIDSKFYIGQTNNIEKRIQRHNQGLVSSTKNRRPFKLIYSENFDTRSQAMKRENYLKSLKGGNEFTKIIGV